METISELNLARNVGGAIVGITAPIDSKFPSRIPRANSPHLRHCVSSNVAWTPCWDSKVLGMIGKQNALGVPSLHLCRTYGSSSVIIHDHRHPNDEQNLQDRQDRAAFVRFGFSSDPGDASDLLSKKACQKGWIDRVPRFDKHTEPNILFKCHGTLSHSCISSHPKPSLKNLPFFDLQVSWLKKSCCQRSEIAPAKPFTAHDVKERRSWRRRRQQRLTWR